MVGHYQRKWSASARWCERLAALGIPYFLLAIILHRTGQITSPQVFWLIAFGAILPLASLLLGFRAFLDLWYSGHKGGRATLRGLIISGLMLAPFLWLGYLSFIHPTLSDVATNPYAPPPFLTAQLRRQQMADKGINPLAAYDPFYSELVAGAYPQLGSRRYNSGVERIMTAVRELVEKRGWQIIETREETGDAPSAGSGEAAGAAGELETAAPKDILIEAEARSPVFGFRQDIVISIISEAETTLVDMRASTRWGPHDFGRNAYTISRFLSDLDASLLGIAGEG